MNNATSYASQEAQDHFLGLPVGDQIALRDIVHHGVANVMNGPKTGENQIPENNTGETLKFGLTLAEKQSIEDDINAGKPIMATPAYIKFLTTILPNGLKEEKDGILGFSHDIPEYEIHGGTIRANYVGAVSIISEGLSALFGRPVRFPTNTEVQDNIAEHHHYAGFRGADNGKSGRVDVVGCGWVGGDAGSKVAPYAGGHRDGYTSSDRGDRRFGFSLFPCFG